MPAKLRAAWFGGFVALCALATVSLGSAVRPGIAAAPLPSAIVRDSAGWRLSVEPYEFRFPRDHASHPDFRTEWWYYTGHLESQGRRFGYELTFFRVGVDRRWRGHASSFAPAEILFAHLALTDVAGRRFLHDERIARPALGIAGADTASEHVWVETWSARLAEDRRTHRLIASNDELSLDLSLEPTKPPVVHGSRGVSRKAEGIGRASHYVSLTRLATRGTIVLAGRRFEVSGQSWMDHEFGSGALGRDLAGWDWVSLNLDSGEDLMLYRLRRKDGTIEPASSGTWIGRDGKAEHLVLEAFELEATGAWTSPKSGGRYPSGWRVRVPSRGLDVTLTPLLEDQELVSKVTGITYWEGAVDAKGTRQGANIAGRGYVELTGYAGRRPDVGP